ncbi:MAG: fumarate hydratase C-terminal domain-containing protein [Sedimentisphaerales bacterium]|nr:fumarate hydratase C-terminal domain-containing protein [Sedimentisphaerales bacterium]
MEDTLIITTPLTEAAVLSLTAGRRVLLTGVLLGGRDAVHLRLYELIRQGKPLPADINGQIIYYVGPTPAPPGRIIGSAGPTTAGRMDRFSPSLFKHGLRGAIGKGYRNEEVRQSLIECRAVHFAALGGAGALLGNCIRSAQIIAYKDLGTEALWRFEVENFPLTVAYDAHGGNVYESISPGI